ncbi:MAG: glycosyltransferase family 2 protein [Clostridium sp.]
MEATIIIATYNEENFIEDCIRSLENQTYPRDKYQIYIIDGESKDNTTKVVEKLITEYENIKLFNNPKKIQAVAFNIGLNNTETEYAFVVGAHAIFDEEFIENSIVSSRENNVECVGGKVTFDAKTKIGQYYALARGTLFGGGTASYRYSNKKQYVDTASFGCYKTKCMKEVSGYNETLVKNQDNDINKRIRANGGKMLFDPSIKFTYFTRDNYKDIKKQMFNYGYWEAKVIKQDSKQFSLVTMVPAAFVIYNVLAILLAFVSFVPLLLCYIPYLLLYTVFYFKDAAGKNPIILLWIYLTIHTSIGIGLIKGWITKES